MKSNIINDIIEEPGEEVIIRFLNMIYDSLDSKSPYYKFMDTLFLYGPLQTSILKFNHSFLDVIETFERMKSFHSIICSAAMSYSTYLKYDNINDLNETYDTLIELCDNEKFPNLADFFIDNKNNLKKIQEAYLNFLTEYKREENIFEPNNHTEVKKRSFDDTELNKPKKRKLF